jgi:hypothetical protein
MPGNKSEGQKKYEEIAKSLTHGLDAEKLIAALKAAQQEDREENSTRDAWTEPLFP